MRCLGHAELPVDGRARESSTTPEPRAGDELRSDYVADDELELGDVGSRRDRARGAGADPVPPECAGLCPVCGKDLNVEPHEHVDRRPIRAGPRSSSLRDDL